MSFQKYASGGGKYLSAKKVKAQGATKVSGTIRWAGEERVGDETKPVVFFHEHKQGVVLNTTNVRTGCEAWGDEPEQWVGKKATFKVENTGQYGDGLVLYPEGADAPVPF